MKETGYLGVLVEKKDADAMVPENPHWDSQGAFRHHEYSVGDAPELDPNQSTPERLDEHEEPTIHFETLGFREPTKHKTSGYKTSR